MYLSLIQERREEKESGRVVLAKQWMWVSVCVSLLRYAQYLSFFSQTPTNIHSSVSSVIVLSASFPSLCLFMTCDLVQVGQV